MAGVNRAAASDLVQSVQRACQLLQAFRHEGEVLRLRELVARTSLHKATASRLVRTLEHERLLERVGEDRLRSRVKVPSHRRYRIGFATRGVDTPFSQAVTASVQRAAEEAGTELVTVSSHRSPRAAVRNAETLVREGVDLVIEFQCHERVAAVISSRFLETGIPVIAIEIPHPGATFFGADNYKAGMIGGQAMARWVKKHWNGEVSSVMLIEEDAAGPLAKLRVSGMLAGMRDALPEVEIANTIEMDGKGSLERTLEAVRRRLRRLPPQRTAVLAGNDPMALGAIRAFEECGRARYCAVMGQNATREARVEMRRPGSPLVGSVAYFPERYGDEVIRLAGNILARQPVPPAVFTKHELVTRENVDRIYALDKLLPEALAAPLVGGR
ncbi:MAG: substrate-binding domain-containing protein [Bryobacteraceae bacterium]